MILTPRPGVPPAQLVDALTKLAGDVSNLRSDSPGRTSYERLIAYLEWAEAASQQLRGLVPAGDIQHLVFGGRYRDLLSLALSETTTAQHGLESFRRTNAEAYNRPREVDQHPVANALLSSELDDRRQVFEEARDAFKAEVEHWAQVGALVVLDTSFYVEHEKLEDGELVYDKVEDVDFARVLDLPGEDIHLIVPMAVVDELDGLKRHHEKRWRAGYALAVLDRVWRTDPTMRLGRLRDVETAHDDPSGAPVAGAVTVGLLADPRGHVRLPIIDDEIVDRAATVRAISGRPVMVVSYDTGMSTRARLAGLRDLKLTKPVPVGDEPAAERGGGRRGRRNR